MMYREDDELSHIEDELRMEGIEMKSELLAMVEELISAIEGVSDLPEQVGVKGFGGKVWEHPRRGFISTGERQLASVKEYPRIGNAEQTLVQMLNGMLFYLSPSCKPLEGGHPYRLHTMPDQCVIDKAQAMIERWYTANPPKDIYQVQKYCFEW